jgi:hypothetical protein
VRLELAMVSSRRARARRRVAAGRLQRVLGLFALLFASLFVIAWYWETAYRMWAMGA